MQKRNNLKTFFGILSIIIVLIIWGLLTGLMNSSGGGGGGAILIFPLIYGVSSIWKNLVLQKKNIKNSKNENEIINGSLKENDDNLNLSDFPESKKRKSLPYKMLFGLWKLTTFNSKSFQNSISEGTRRLLFILSFLLPFLCGLLYYKLEAHNRYYSSNSSFVAGYFYGYILFHFGLRVAIWIIKGYKVNS